MLTIKVEKEHIRHGKADREADCAVALAMKDAGCTFPVVRDDWLRWGLCDNRHLARTPQSVVRFIALDAPAEDGEPFTFKLEGGL